MESQKPIKALISDCLPIDQPKDTIRFGKNGIQNYKLGSVFNEPGFLKSAAVLPFKVCGIMETDTVPIFFTTDNTNSAIGFFNTVTDTYEAILDDRNLNFRVGFNTANYITGEYQKNNKGEYQIAFTNNDLPMMFLNCASPGVVKFEDLLFFVRSLEPKLEVKVGDAGQIDSGSYRVAVKLQKDDGTETGYLGLTGYTFIAAISATDTANKSLSIHITNIDPNYTKAVIAIINQSNGILKAIELAPVQAAPTMDIVYTGSESFTTITVEEILIPAKNYNKVGTITQLNDSLYIGNLTEEDDIVYQQYANNITVEFSSDLYDLTDVKTYENIKNGVIRGFAHEEVYAFYIRLKKKSSGFTRAFHIPGRALAADDLTTLNQDNISGLKFQLDDTIVNYDGRTGIGTCGAWQNQNEVYPNLPMYGALQGHQVRHHKMPSLRFIKSSLGSRTDQIKAVRYGKSVLDVLGVRLNNVIIPTELTTKLTGDYEILFAKRTQANTTNYGNSLLLFNSIKETNLAAYNTKFSTTAANPAVNTQNTHLITSGGNWKTKVGTWNSFPADVIVRESFRLYPFETLQNKPDFPSKMYASINWKTSCKGDIAGNTNNNVVDVRLNFDLTETTKINSTVLTDTAFKNIGIGNLVYLNTNINYDAITGVQNQKAEACILATTLKTALETVNLTIPDNRVNVGTHNKNYTTVIPNEDSFFVTLKALKNDLYKSFNTQVLIGTSDLKSIVTTDFITRGDTFISLHGFHTYGSFGYSGSTDNLPRELEKTGGYKVSRTYLVESTANLGNRYELTGNQYSFWFLRQGNFEYLKAYETDAEPNQVGYSKELNAIAEVPTSIYLDDTTIVTDFPYRIHRGGKSPREGLFRNWRKLLSLDYYDMPKNLGKIVNLEGMDDKLLIHLENSLMITQDKTKLESDTLAVTLGAGNIFSFTPQEAISAKLGLAGTRHDLACYKTPFGYVFPDSSLGQLFVYKEGIKQLNGGLNDFLTKYLKVTDVNPFIGNGITIGYDPKYKRVLITVKATTVLSTTSLIVEPTYEETTDYFSRLVVNQSVVFKEGRWQLFLGVNASAYNCPVLLGPTADNLTITIPENTSLNVKVGNLVHTQQPNTTLVFNIIAGNTGSDFKVTNTGEIIVNGVLKFSIKPTYSLSIEVTDTNGRHVTATVNINITGVQTAPVIPDYNIFVNENTANNTEILTVLASSNLSPLTYSITGGNSLNAFQINASTGIIKIVDTTKLDYETIKLFRLTVNVSDGTLSSSGNVFINILDVNEPPIFSGTTYTIPETTVNTTIIGTLTEGTDPELTELTYFLITESHPGTFGLDVDRYINGNLPNRSDNPNFLTVKVLDNTVFATVASCSLLVRAIDAGSPNLYTDVVVNIVITPVAMTIAWSNTPHQNPHATVGFFVIKNFIEVLRVDYLGSGVLSGLLSKDSVQIYQFHYLNWRNPADATNTLIVNDGVDLLNATVAASSLVNSDSQNTAPFILKRTKTYTITSSSNSTDASLSSAILTTLNSFGYKTGDLKIEIIDNTTGLVMLYVDNREDATVHYYDFNYKTDANTLIVKLTSNVPSTTISVVVDGINGFTATRNVVNPTVQTITDIPKGSIAITINGGTIGNETQSTTLQKNNCSEGYSGLYRTYTVPANTYFASTLAAANNLALDDIAANGQNYANGADCIRTVNISTLLIDYYDTDQNADLCLYSPTTGITLQNQIVTNRHIAGSGVHFLPTTETTALASYLIAGDNIVQATLKRRFGVNMAKYIQDHPGIDTFEFVLRGRTSSAAKSISGVYALRISNQGYLSMSGSEGTYSPTVVGSSGSIVSWADTIPSGGDGSVGTGIGEVLLRLTYVVSTNTLTRSSI